MSGTLPTPSIRASPVPLPPPGPRGSGLGGRGDPIKIAGDLNRLRWENLLGVEFYDKKRLSSFLKTLNLASNSTIAARNFQNLGSFTRPPPLAQESPVRAVPRAREPLCATSSDTESSWDTRPLEPRRSARRSSEDRRDKNRRLAKGFINGFPLCVRVYLDCVFCRKTPFGRDPFFFFF